MKKSYSLLAIAAIALTSVCSFSSCGEKDEIQKPEPEPVVLHPVDSLVADFEYEYSTEALQLFDIKYEVTDFNGKIDRFAVTEAGKVVRHFKTTNVTDVANVKLIVTAKDVKSVGDGETFTYGFSSHVTSLAYVGGEKFFAGSGFEPYIASTTMSVPVAQSDIKTVQEDYVGTHEAKIFVQESLHNGVSYEWLKEHAVN